MSRHSVTYGNGAKCDICDKALTPRETLRLNGLRLELGPNYNTCSSDIRYRRTDLFHLCEGCYKKIVEKIKEKTI